MARVYIQSHGPDVEALKRGLVWLAGYRKPGLIAVRQKSELDGFFGDSLGADAARLLKKGGSLAVGPSQASLMTEKNPRRGWTGAVLAVYPNRGLLDQIDDLPTTDVCIIPWNKDDDDVRQWIATWSAQSADGNPIPANAAAALDPIAVAALKALTECVNVSSGLAHPSDHASAVELFEILRDNRVAFTPDTVRAWLVSQGHWGPSEANDVENVCRDVLAGKRLRVQRGRWDKTAIERWKAAP